MKKKAIGLGLALILIFLLLVSCGIPQEQYDKVSSDFTAAQAQIQTLQVELATNNTELSAKENELKATQSALSVKENELKATQSVLSAKENELKATQSALSAKENELSATQTQLKSLQEDNDAVKVKLEQGKARVEILNDILVPSLTGELYGMTESELVNFFLKWRDKIIAIGDPTLTAKFQKIIDTGSDEASLSFFLYLLESIPKALGYTYSSTST